MSKTNQITVVAYFVSMLLTATASFGGELNFGSPSPEFSAIDLRGNPIENNAKGKISVVEFGGTTCIPCIKLIPEMNALQDRYPSVAFVSVFCENIKAVKTFMKGPGKTMQVRVAIDESGRIKKDWLDAAGLQGIPQAFIIDRSGRLAWFGYPDTDKFSTILEKVVNGTYDSRLENMRLRLQRKIEEDNRKLFDWVEKVNDVSQRAYECKTPTESIAVIDKALPEFAGSPERIRLSMMKLEFYQNVPNSRQQAFQHALNLAVEAVKERNPNSYVSACEYMLSHCEYALAENKDSRLADLALTVLLDKTATTNHVELRPDGQIRYQAKWLATIAAARRQRGELPLALEELRNGIAVLRKRDLKDKPKWWLDEHKQTLSQLESKLSDWEQESKVNR